MNISSTTIVSQLFTTMCVPERTLPDHPVIMTLALFTYLMQSMRPTHFVDRATCTSASHQVKGFNRHNHDVNTLNQYFHESKWHSIPIKSKLTRVVSPNSSIGGQDGCIALPAAYAAAYGAAAPATAESGVFSGSGMQSDKGYCGPPALQVVSWPATLDCSCSCSTVLK